VTPLQDPPDELGAEMAKEARVWRTYVRETDRWDKEMVEGRNKYVYPSQHGSSSILILSFAPSSLDVLLSE
jgi:hypothetical protein